MNSLTNIPKIKKLADQFGNPMQDVDFIGEGIRFRYKVGNEELVKDYSSVEDGIREELERLSRLLNLEI